jgi:Ca2+-binding EF-hand superfamily protein
MREQMASMANTIDEQQAKIASLEKQGRLMWNKRKEQYYLSGLVTKQNRERIHQEEKLASLKNVLEWGDVGRRHEVEATLHDKVSQVDRLETTLERTRGQKRAQVSKAATAQKRVEMLQAISKTREAKHKDAIAAVEQRWQEQLDVADMNNNMLHEQNQTYEQMLRKMGADLVAEKKETVALHEQVHKHNTVVTLQVRKTPTWPRSWANFSLSWLYSTGMHGQICIFWANLTPFSLQRMIVLKRTHTMDAMLEQLRQQVPFPSSSNVLLLCGGFYCMRDHIIRYFPLSQNALVVEQGGTPIATALAAYEKQCVVGFNYKMQALAEERAAAMAAEARLQEEVDVRTALEQRAEAAEARAAELQTTADAAAADAEKERAATLLTNVVSALRTQLIRAGVTDIVTAFEQFDADGDGTLTADELAAGLHRLRIGLSKRQLAELLSTIDVDGDQEVSIAEFASQFDRLASLEEDAYRRQLAHQQAFEMAESVLARMQERLVDHGLSAAEAFHLADADGDGSVSLAELASGLAALGIDLSEEEQKGLLAVLDLDGDGMIDFNEFISGLGDPGMTTEEEAEADMGDMI